MTARPNDSFNRNASQIAFICETRMLDTLNARPVNSRVSQARYHKEIQTVNLICAVLAHQTSIRANAIAVGHRPTIGRIVSVESVLKSDISLLGTFVRFVAGPGVQFVRALATWM